MMTIQRDSPWTLRLARHAPRLVAVTTTFLALCGGVCAQQPQQALEARIVVAGEGSVSVTPNYAYIRVGVTTRTKTVKEAVDTNSKRMAAIIAALKDAGVAEKDVQTAGFSIQPIYAPATTASSQEPRAEPKFSSYSVSNHVNVTVREIGKVGDLLDRAVAAGATDVHNVLFLVSDSSKALDQAREAAIADARRKAEVYAKASGVRLGGVEWITEDTAADKVLMMSRAAVAPVPITSGEDTLRVRVTVAFNIMR